MCCFSGPVTFVSDTQIFARPEDDGHQVIAYAMRVGIGEDVAMILPLPVPPGGADDSVEFIDLSGYADFFDDLKSAFPKIAVPQMRSLNLSGEESLASVPLVVHRVGDFEASFVPSIDAFDRLDTRFQLPKATWDRLPQYADWGFAVFKLRAGTTEGHPSGKTYHPMAFRFPRRDASSVFFPTVHIHDGEVHEHARFAHELYIQSERRPEANGWSASECPIDERVNEKRAAGLIMSGMNAFQRILNGRLENKDIFVAS